MVGDSMAISACANDVEDIEDLSLAGADHSASRPRNRPFVLRRTVKQSACETVRPQADSFIPGKVLPCFSFDKQVFDNVALSIVGNHHYLGSCQQATSSMSYVNVMFTLQ